MKKVVIVILSLVVLVGVSSSAYAHPGRLDKNGGHNCSAKSKQKGLCTGYHYHKRKNENELYKINPAIVQCMVGFACVPLI